MSDALSQSWLDLPDGTRFELHGSTSVGRSPDNALVLHDPLVSRRHALIQVQGEGEFWLVDLGSANGSYLNGRRIAQPAELKAGDEITLSGTVLRFGSERLQADHPSAAGLMASTMMSIKTAKCWMMMVDIVGSTQLAQRMSAEELPVMTGNWFKNCREIIEAHGGHMMKYLGDGFFCYWIANEQSPEQVRGALEQLKLMQDAASPPFRVVVHFGPAVLGSVPTVSELNLHGQEVNFTFRIEKLAGSLRRSVMLSREANEALGLETQLVAKAPVEGFTGTYSFYVPV
jgi:pSer/pThr/pTyr-binding forkhead associated (FHA) protein